jgi:hypothetical protein
MGRLPMAAGRDKRTGIEPMEEWHHWVRWKHNVEEEERKKPYELSRFLDNDEHHSFRVNQPWGWGSAQQAARAIEDGQGDGVGFVFTEEDPFCGVDLDKCITDGVVHPKAAELVARLDGYVEQSVSGTGLHVIVEGRWNSEGHVVSESNTGWGGKLEIYDRKRFFTMTGVGSGDIRDAQSELDRIANIKEWFPPRPKPRKSAARKSSNAKIGDVQLIERIKRAKNGAKFAKLWAGDISDYVKAESDSQHEADMALCNFFAYWTDGDAERIDRHFQMWVRYPQRSEKWDQDHYRERTIEKAIEESTDFCDRVGIHGVGGADTPCHTFQTYTELEVLELKRRYRIGELKPWEVGLGKLPNKAKQHHHDILADLKLQMGLIYADRKSAAVLTIQYAVRPGARAVFGSAAPRYRMKVWRALGDFVKWGVVRIPSSLLSIADDHLDPICEEWEKGTALFLPLSAAPSDPESVIERERSSQAVEFAPHRDRARVEVHA